MANSREIKEDTFGGQLYRLRKTALLSFDDFRIALGVTKTYLNDVETGFVRPPTPKMQISMVQILSAKKPLPQAEVQKLFDLAAKARGELPADIYLYLANSGDGIEKIRADAEYSAYSAYSAKIFR